MADDAGSANQNQSGTNNHNQNNGDLDKVESELPGSTMQPLKTGIPRLKLVVVGDGACGKTSLLTVFAVSHDSGFLESGSGLTDLFIERPISGRSRAHNLRDHRPHVRGRRQGGGVRVVGHRRPGGLRSAPPHVLLQDGRRLDLLLNRQVGTSAF